MQQVDDGFRFLVEKVSELATVLVFMDSLRIERARIQHSMNGLLPDAYIIRAFTLYTYSLYEHVSG